MLTATAAVAFDSNDETVHVPSLMARARELERQFEHQDMFFLDMDLQNYLKDILEKMATPEEIRQFNLRVRILKTRDVNAFAAPDGAIYITTALLSRVTNETQVAAIIGHEIGHVVGRHAERNLLARKKIARALVFAAARESAKKPSKRTARASARTPTVLSPDREEYSRIFSSGIAIAQDAFQFSEHGYVMELEKEADSAGIARMTAAGFALSKITRGGRNDDMEKAYLKVKLWNVVIYEAAMNLAAGRFDIVDEQLDRLLAVDECNPAALSMRGDMERFMSPRSTASIMWYEKALACDPDNHGALLSLGLAHHSTGENAKAREYLGRYAEAAADGIDIKMVREVIRRCGE